MKSVITNQEMNLLDDLAVAAGDLEYALGRVGGQQFAAEGILHAQHRLAHAIAVLLAVDDWDQEKWAIIGAYIRAGGREQLEAFVDRLGITIDTNQNAGEAGSTQGGSVGGQGGR